MLAFPNFVKHSLLETDASGVVLGVVLGEKVREKGTKAGENSVFSKRIEIKLNK